MRMANSCHIVLALKGNNEMTEEHKKIQLWMKERYSKRYIVEAEIDKQNKLPDANRDWYRPDVVIKNSSEKIKYIIEVENDPTRKAIVGAVILADASLNALNQKGKLYFVIYNSKGIRQIPNFKSKIEIAKKYCKSLHEVNIVSYSEFQKVDL